MTAGLEFFKNEIRPIELDPDAYDNNRSESAYRLNVVTDPALRVIGFAVVAVAVWLHNRTLLPPGTAPSFTAAALVFTIYPLASWLLLYLCYPRWRRLPFLLLFSDIALLLLAVYFSGGERSYLFFLPLFRVVDQTHTSLRRAMLFGHVVVVGYALMVAWLIAIQRRPVAVGGEAVKFLILYASVVYTALRARVAEANRKRIASAVRMIEESNGQLGRKTVELQESQQQLRRVMAERERILESAAEGIVGFDTTGRITLANRRAAKTIGFEPDNLVGRAGHELAVHARPDGSVCDGKNCPLEAALFSGQEERGENAGFLRKDGTTVPVEYSSAPMFDEGKLVGAVFAFRDVSERMRMERELIAARDAAEEGSRAKSQFLANMSHELRTPLNAIIGYSEMIEEEAKDGGHEDLIPDLEKIRTAGRHLLALLTDVIDIAKIEAGRMDVAVETLDIATLLFELTTAIEPGCQAKRNVLTVRSSADGSVVTDGAKLRRILLNLTNNANKFTEGGAIEVMVAREGGRVSFAVTDNGIGMTTEQTAHLFQPFTQADASHTRKHGGQGVGLAISRRLASLLHAELSVESTPGRGSTFKLAIPDTDGGHKGSPTQSEESA